MVLPTLRQTCVISTSYVLISLVLLMSEHRQKAPRLTCIGPAPLTILGHSSWTFSKHCQVCYNCVDTCNSSFNIFRVFIMIAIVIVFATTRTTSDWKCGWQTRRQLRCTRMLCLCLVSTHASQTTWVVCLASVRAARYAESYCRVSICLLWFCKSCTVYTY